MPFGYEWRRGSTAVASNTVNALIDFYSFTAPTGVGTQLYRVVVRNLANSGINANAACNIVTLADADGDGVADIWETVYGLNTNNIADAELDLDGDTMSNRAEFLAGTDPTNPSSYLKIDSITADGMATLVFGAISNRTYSVQYSDALGRGPGSDGACGGASHQLGRVDYRSYVYHQARLSPGNAVARVERMTKSHMSAKVLGGEFDGWEAEIV
jgi:hypothetical protein